MEKESLTKEALEKLVYRVTGHRYTFATVAIRRWGQDGKEESDGYSIGFFQLMPNGADGGFFNDYCERREWYQFFRSREDCALTFMRYWFEWKGRSKDK